MAKAIPPLKIAIDFQDKGSQALINKLVGSLTKLQLSASGARPNIKGLRAEILAQGNASIKSVSNINAQRNALSALRDEAKLGGKTFNQLTQDIKKLDAQLGKTQKARGGARAATQIGGAVISGGIFGGPEGAAGALTGAAFGGVEGAFAGAAIGAALGGLRETIGETAAYAASIEKLKIALNGVLPDQDDFNAAIQAARSATEELNIPQEQSIRGITRLSAAVKGAGGPVQDAATTFRNVTAAIKATGGSADDVQGAITAMVQVFSKGKVSAEELSGQLGERLPGAVTLFAKANKMTLPELQKNLKAGTVGLNELMNFIVELGDTFDGTARQISDSNADAGARLAVVIQDMRAEIGTALIPIGADFQTAFADFIENITPFLVQTVPAIGKLFVDLAKNIDTLAVAATAGLAAFSIAKLVAIALNFGKITTAVVALKNALIALNLVNPYTALAAGAAFLAAEIFRASKEQDRFNKLVREGSVAQVDAQIKAKQLEQDELISRKLRLGDDPTEQYYGAEQAFLDDRIKKIKDEILLLKERKRTAKIDAEQGADLPSSLLKRFDYGDPAADGDKDGGTSAVKALERRRDAAAEIARRLREALGISQAQNEVEKLLAQQSKERSDLKAKFARLQKGGLDAEIQQQEEIAEGLLLEKQRADLTAQTNKLGQKTVDDITKITDKIKQKFQSDQEYKRLLAEGITPELAKQLVAINAQFAAGDKLLQQRILDFQAQLDQTELSKQEIENIKEQIRLLEEKREILGQTATKAKEQATTYGDETNNFQTFKDTFKAGIEEMGNLYENLGNAAANAFSGMADVVADFVTTGSASFKEFARSVLADLSRIFIRMAFFQAFQGLGLFGNGGVVNKGTTPPTTLPGSVGAVAAKGLAIGKNGIMPFAKGGIVTKPTLFKYADGGSGRFGLMGEAGSEAIMPLRRGRNGKLGVESSGGVGNVVVNVDASGSSVEGDQPNAKLLGAVIGAAVQSELIKQKRPGGLLS